MSKKKENRDISVIVGVFVQNEKGEILFGRMPKWNDKWAVFGGHIERGELIEGAARRELKEETGLKADSLEYLFHFEIIDPKEFIKPKHFVGFNFRYTVEGRPEVETNEEFTEEKWMTIEEALSRDDINELTRQTLEKMKVDGCENCQEYKTGWQRAQADYQNLKKEMSEKKIEWAQMSEIQIIEEFMPVLGNMKMAFAADSTNMDSWKQGIEMIMKQFQDVIVQHGLNQIKTVGEEFNPELHEALAEEESEEESGIIVKEVEAGYRAGEKVIRPAKVIVSK
ncbi:MAG: nucleotide exchange factor GrpE [Candidatus Magasanikbacteria bacterium]